jgi:hypothetical protein
LAGVAEEVVRLGVGVGFLMELLDGGHLASGLGDLETVPDQDGSAVAGGQRRAHPDRACAAWVKATVDAWVRAAELDTGKPFRCVCRARKCWGDGVTERVVWHVVKQYAAELGFRGVAPHDPRRSCAKLCHAAGGELEQIQFLFYLATFRSRALGWIPMRSPGRWARAEWAKSIG